MMEMCLLREIILKKKIIELTTFDSTRKKLINFFSLRIKRILRFESFHFHFFFALFLSLFFSIISYFLNFFEKQLFSIPLRIYRFLRRLKNFQFFTILSHNLSFISHSFTHFSFIQKKDVFHLLFFLQNCKYIILIRSLETANNIYTHVSNQSSTILPKKRL